MNEELLRCPFCGGEAISFGLTLQGGFTWWVRCTACGAETDGYNGLAEAEAEAEAIAAWNRRAERTCEYIGDEISGGCSECRGWLDPACAYCPSCGAKVVER